MPVKKRYRSVNLLVQIGSKSNLRILHTYIPLKSDHLHVILMKQINKAY